MKKILVISFLALFLIGFVSAISLTGSAVGDANSNQENKNITDAAKNAVQAGLLGIERIREIQKIQNRLRINATECPNNCTCSGSTTKCNIDGGREMTIRAGKSGNTIVQVKGINASTKVELYKADGKVYGNFSGNRTHAVEFMPDEVQDKIQERLKLQNCSCDMELDEDGNYQVEARKRARLFGLFPVREKVKIQMNSETGEIIRQRTSWWGFLARDIDENETDSVITGETETQ